MFYRQLAEVSAYVADNKYQVNEMLRLLCLRAMSSLQVEALIFNEIDSHGNTQPKHYFGFDMSDLNGHQPSFLIADKTPFTDCIRENRMIWIDSLPAWPRPYAAMNSIHIPKHFKTLITCPVENRGLPVGSLSIFSRTKLTYDESIAQFIEAISMMLASTFNTNSHPIGGMNPAQPGSYSAARSFEDTELGLQDFQEPLTERQNLILKLISEGRTNAAIADVLGYSESLIRQETIRIYANLGCSGRNEASQIYLRNNTNHSNLIVKNSA